MREDTEDPVATTISLSIDIERPVAEVRRHTFDIPYHAARRLHPHITYTVRSIAPGRIRYLQEVSILKVKQRDECNQLLLPNGDVVTEVIAGFNRGFKVVFHFEEIGPNLTRMHAQFTVPLPGLRRWIAPLFRRAVLQAAKRALEEDKADLESLSYRHHSGAG